MKDMITDSIRYWEPRRVAFNAALALVAAGSFVCHLPASAGGPIWQSVAGLLLAAAVANLLYSMAYVADLFVQMSAYREGWKRRRWALFAAGTVLAAALFLLHE